MYYILQGSEIEWASQYKYLGKTIDDSLSSTPCIRQPVKKLKLKLGVYFPVYLFLARKRLLCVCLVMVMWFIYIGPQNAYISCILFILEQWDLLQTLTLLLTLVHCMLSLGGLLCYVVDSATMFICRFFIYKAILGLLKSYILTYINQKLWEIVVLGSMFHHFVCPRSSNGIWKRRIQIYHS